MEERKPGNCAETETTETLHLCVLLLLSVVNCCINIYIVQKSLFGFDIKILDGWDRAVMSVEFRES